MKPLLDIVNATKTFSHTTESITAFHDVHLQVQPGHIVSVIGPSGCGKSSLLRAVAGLENLSHGRIILDGMPVDGINDHVGIVFQEPRLLPWLRVWENVALPGRLHKNAHLKVDRSTVDGLLEQLGLASFRTAYPRHISGGMAQRVALARALVRRPRLVLFDEPFAALDALRRSELQTWLRQLLKERRTAALFVTHDIDEALAVGDRIALLTPHPGTIFRTYDLPGGLKGSENQRNHFREQILIDLKVAKEKMRKERAS